MMTIFRKPTFFQKSAEKDTLQGNTKLPIDSNEEGGVITVKATTTTTAKIQRSRHSFFFPCSPTDSSDGPLQSSSVSAPSPAFNTPKKEDDIDLIKGLKTNEPLVIQVPSRSSFDVAPAAVTSMNGKVARVEGISEKSKADDLKSDLVSPSPVPPPLPFPDDRSTSVSLESLRRHNHSRLSSGTNGTSNSRTSHSRSSYGNGGSIVVDSMGSVTLNFERIQEVFFAREASRDLSSGPHHDEDHDASLLFSPPEALWDAYLRVLNSCSDSGRRAPIENQIDLLPSTACDASDTSKFKSQTVNGGHNESNSTLVNSNRQISQSEVTPEDAAAYMNSLVNQQPQSKFNKGYIEMTRSRTLETVFVKGTSGVGKTYLLEDFQRKIRQHALQTGKVVAILQAKHVMLASTAGSVGNLSVDTSYHHLSTASLAAESERGETIVTPFAAFHDILEQLFRFLLRLQESSVSLNSGIDAETMDRFCAKLRECIIGTTPSTISQDGGIVSYLLKKFPPISLLLKGTSKEDNTTNRINDNQKETLSSCEDGDHSVIPQFGLVFVRILRVVSKMLSTVPVILLIDDLQWADSESLDLISALIGETQLDSVLLVGSFREGSKEENRNRTPKSHSAVSVYSIVARKNVRRTGEGQRASSIREISESGVPSTRLLAFQSWSAFRHIPKFRSPNKTPAERSLLANADETPPDKERKASTMTSLRKAVTLGTYSPPKNVVPGSSDALDSIDPSLRTFSTPVNYGEQSAPGRLLSLIDDDDDDDKPDSKDEYHLQLVPMVPPPVSFGKVPQTPREKEKVQLPPLPSNPTSLMSSRFSLSSFRGSSRQSLFSRSSRNLDGDRNVSESTETSARMIPRKGRRGNHMVRHSSSSYKMVVPKVTIGHKIRSKYLSHPLTSTSDTSCWTHKNQSESLQSPREFLAHFQITELPLGPWDKHSICSCLARLLNTPTDECCDLAFVIQRKTQGNPSSVLRFIDFLERDGLLVFSMKSYRWEWDASHIDEVTMATSDVGELLAARVKLLPPESLEILKVAACIGLSFDRRTLEGTVAGHALESKLLEETKVTLPRILKESCDAGLLESPDHSLYRFSHDLVHQNLYSQIEAQRLGRLHMHVAETIKASLVDGSTSTTPSDLYLCANHFYFGRNYVSGTKRIEAAELLVQASNAARVQYSFRAAAIFLDRAISIFLCEEDWSMNYSLILEAYSAAAEVSFACGELHRSMVTAEKIIQNARRVEERLRGYFVKIDVLATQRHFNLALEESFRLLGVLGCHIPKRLKQIHVFKDLLLVKKRLGGKSLMDFTSMRLMTNVLKLSSLRVMDTMTLLYALKGDDKMSNLILTRMILTTIDSGISVYAPYSLAGYGMLLLCFGDVDEGYRYGELSLQLAESFKSKRAMVRTAFLVYTFLSWTRKPLTEGIEVMLNAHRMGMQVGDLEYSSMCLCSYANLYIAVGLPLNPFVDDMKEFLEQLELYHQNQSVAMMICFHQMALNLAGRSKSYLSGFRSDEDGEAMQLESFYHRFFATGGLDENDHSFTLVNLKFSVLLLAYIFEDLEELNSCIMMDRPPNGVLTRSHFMNIYVDLFSGLAAYSIFRATRKRKHFRKANAILTSMDDLSKVAGINVVPLHRILLAEKYTFTIRNHAIVKMAFDDAITTSARCGLIHLEAISAERAGDFMTAINDAYWSQLYFERAIERYMEWGATAKATAMRSKLPVAKHHLSSTTHSIVDGRNSDSVKISLRGKRRYDPSTWHSIGRSDLAEHGSENRRRME